METSGINFKSGFVSIIGLPNAGKSTFLNSVIDEKIAITSRKPQTTRRNLKGIYNDDDSQIVFVDTPGVNEGKTILDDYMAKSVKASIDSIDLIIVIVDINTYNDDNYYKLIEILKKQKTKKILIINKIDAYTHDVDEAKKEIISRFGESIIFDKVLSISALKKRHIKEVIECVKEYLVEGAQYYDKEYITDEPTKKIVADMIRMHCLYKLSKEIPHSLDVTVDSMKLSRSKCMNINATIICDKDAHKKIIIGTGGQMIKNIGTGARISIEKFLDQKVNLKLNVVVKNNWRNEKSMLANFGYDFSKI